MAVTRRKRADQTTLVDLPKVPAQCPSDWPPSLYQFLVDLMRTLAQQPTVVVGVQKNGVDMPLRSTLNFTAGATITDDQANDATKIHVP